MSEGQSAEKIEAADLLAGVGASHIRGECQHLERKVRKGWNVPDEARLKLVERLTAFVNDPDTSLRALQSIGRLLAQLDRCDIDAEAGSTPPVALQVNLGARAPEDLTEAERRMLADASRLLDRIPIQDSQSHSNSDGTP